MGGPPRLPLTTFGHIGIAGRRSLSRDQLECIDLVTNRQQRPCDIVCEQHALTFSRIDHPNSPLSDDTRQVRKIVVRLGVGIYNTATTIRQDVKASPGANSRSIGRVIKKIAVGPCPAGNTLYGSPLGPKLLYLDLSSDNPAWVHTDASTWRVASPVPPPTTVMAWQILTGGADATRF